MITIISKSENKRTAQIVITNRGKSTTKHVKMAKGDNVYKDGRGIPYKTIS